MRDRAEALVDEPRRSSVPDEIGERLDHEIESALAQPRSWWTAHDIAQVDFYARILAEKADAAWKRYDQARLARQLAEAPRWVTGHEYTEQELRDARDRERAAEVEACQLEERLHHTTAAAESLRVEYETELAAERRPAAGDMTAPAPQCVSVAPARTDARPREQHHGRRRRGSSSPSSDSDGSDSDGNDPPPVGRALGAASGRRAA